MIKERIYYLVGLNVEYFNHCYFWDEIVFKCVSVFDMSWTLFHHLYQFSGHLINYKNKLSKRRKMKTCVHALMLKMTFTF